MIRLSLALTLLTAAPLGAAAPPASRDGLPPGATLRVGSAKLRHGGLVRAVAFSPDGKSLASAGHDRLVSVWDVATGKERFRLTGHAGDVTSLSFAPDGAALASGSADGSVRLWSMADASEIAALPRTDGVDALAFSPDGKRLAVATDAGRLAVYDAAARKEVFSKQIDRGLWAVAWSADGKTLATSGEARNSVVVWSAADGKMLRTFGGDTIQCLAYAPQGERLVTWEDGGTLRAWDAEKGSALKKFGGDGPDGLVYQIAFAADGKSVFAGTADGAVEQWDAATGKRLRRVVTGHRGRVTALAVRGGVLATGGADHAVRLHDLRGGKAMPSADDSEPVTSLTAADGGRTLVALLASGEVRLWDRATGTRLRVPKYGPAVAAAGGPAAAALWVVDAEGKMRLHDVAKGSAKLVEGEDPLAALTASADGTVLAGVLRNGTVPLYDARTGKRLHVAKARERGATAALSHDGATVAVVGKAAAVALFDVKTGGEVPGVQGHGGGTLAAAFSPDGRLLATGGRDRFLRIWELQTRRERVARMPHAAWVKAVAFSPDGKLVATGTAEGAVALYDPATGRLKAELTGHRGPVTGLTFAAREALVSAGSDGGVIVWDLGRVKLDGLEPVELTAARRERLWATLGDDDAVTAALASRELARDAAGTVRLISASVAPIDGEQVARWIEELDDEKFAVRGKAAESLEKLGRSVEGALRARLGRKPELEQRRRIEELLVKLKATPGAGHLRAVRAVALLEEIGTPAAAEALRKLAAGAQDVELTREAKASLGRMKR